MLLIWTGMRAFCTSRVSSSILSRINCKILCLLRHNERCYIANKIAPTISWSLFHKAGIHHLHDTTLYSEKLARRPSNSPNSHIVNCLQPGLSVMVVASLRSCSQRGPHTRKKETRSARPVSTRARPVYLFLSVCVLIKSALQTWSRKFQPPTSLPHCTNWL